jgi:cytochrome c oxidase subunit 3
MAIKFNEWSAKIHHGIYPNSAELLKEEPGKIIFYGLYYSMTGLHALHVLIGMAILAYMFIPLFQRPFESTQWDVFRKPDLQGCSFSLKDKDGKEIWSSDKVDDSVKNMQVRFKYYPKEGRVKASDYVALENSGLYWHLVDLIWIFLFPLFYIIH